MVKFTDTPEQARAIQAPLQHDMLIVAGAGSGKTYTMTRRVIELIERGVKPERILGLTFTNKAAAELLSRVSQAVNQHAQVDTSGLLKPEVMTYDAFFQSIVRQYGLLVGFNQQMQPLSDAGAQALVESVIGDYLDTHPQIIDMFDFSTLSRSVLQLADNIASSMIGLDACGNVCKSVSEAVCKVQSWNHAWIEHLTKVLLNDSARAQEVYRVSSVRLPKYGKNDTDETFLQKWRKYVDQNVSNIEGTAVQQAYSSCEKLKETALKRAVLLDLVAMFDKAKREMHMAQFSDFTIAAYQLVTQFASLATSYRQRYEHVLLDEYQDTSTTQAMLIAALFHENSLAQPITHITAVGDPFQAIYAFRGASSGAFSKFIRTFQLPNEQQYCLTYTRRNAQRILQAANTITQPLRANSGQASSFSCDDGDRTNQGSCEIAVESLRTPPQTSQGTVGIVKAPTQYQQIEAVVRFAQYVKSTPMSPSDRLTNSHARLAVLFRNKTAMPAYEQALREAGLTTMSVGYSALFDKPSVRDILALLHVVDDHSNTTALMRLLATPRLSMSAQDLKQLASVSNDVHRDSVFQACVEAGLLSADLPLKDRSAALRGMPESVMSASVYVADIIMRDVSATKQDPVMQRLEQQLSAHGMRALRRAHTMLLAVNTAQSYGLQDAIRAASEALQIDIDSAVSHALHGIDDDTRREINALVDLADTYSQEVSDWHTPTLHGFLAWVERLRDSDTASSSIDESVDVVLMTVHQSKGLEWPAVAIVGLEDGVFPSSQGDALSVTPIVCSEPNMREDDSPRPYHSVARSSLEDATKVPTILRVDADILPRFPNHCSLQECVQPELAFATLDTVEAIDDEVYANRRQRYRELRGKIASQETLSDEMMRMLMNSVDQACSKLSQCSQREASGKLLHDDERHLMYVALTRAQYAVLLTCAQTTAMSLEALSNTSRMREPSIFFNELVTDPAIDGADRVMIKQRLQNNQDEAVLIEGCVIGDHAQAIADMLAKPSSIPAVCQETALRWPASLSRQSATMLQMSKHMLEHDDDESHAADQVHEDCLFAKAQQLVEDRDLTFDRQTSEHPQALREQAERLMRDQRVNVTTLQRVVSEGGQRQISSRLIESWKALIRPIPILQTPQADLGTHFHTWAQAYLNAAHTYDIEQWDAVIDRARVHGYQLSQPLNSERSIMLEALKCQAEHNVSSGEQHQLTLLKQRFVSSVWAGRLPLSAELPIVAYIPQLRRIINGKIDAIFAGGLDVSDASRRYTIVDWKTGSKPVTRQQLDEKLAQLDWYRLLVSKMTGTSLDAIDAILYYISEEDECQREVQAHMKCEAEILASLQMQP